jgi:GT2 family glycosyltransferase
MDPKVGVTILTFNAAEYLGACLASLYANTYPNFQVVVVDNASVDQTTFLIQKQFPQTHLIQNKKNLGFAKGNNRGLRYLLDQGCTYFLLLNDDTEVDQQLIEKLVKPMRDDPQIGIVGPIITCYKQPETIWFAGGEFNQTFAYTRHPHLGKKLRQTKHIKKRVDFVTGCCLMTKRQVLEQIGFLDETFGYYFEDVFFCLKAKKAGFYVRLVDKPLVKHRVSATSRREGLHLSPFQAYYFARNPFLFINQETSRWQKLTQILGQFLIRFPYYSYQIMKQGTPSVFASYSRGLIDGLSYLRDKNHRS